MARNLDSLGRELIVADPNYAPMYANRSRRAKAEDRGAWQLRPLSTGAEIAGNAWDKPAVRRCVNRGD